MHYKEQDADQVAAFLEALEHTPKTKRVYVDQSGMGDDERPARGYSKRGTLCIGKKPAFAREKLNMMAGLWKGKIIEPLVYAGNCTAALVEKWMQTCLLPTLEAGCVIIMDNAPVHRKSVPEAIAHTFHCTIRWLPPYSPNLNDIEPYWSVIKHHARKALCHTASTLYDAFQYAFNSIL